MIKRLYSNDILNQTQVIENSDGTFTPTVAVTGSEDSPIKTEVTGRKTLNVKLFNAVAITDTSANRKLLTDLIDDDEIRSYSEFKLSFNNTHDQAANIRVYQSIEAFGNTNVTGVGTIYQEQEILPSGNGRMVIQPFEGGTGATSSEVIVPALRNIFSNLIVEISFNSAPQSGSITVSVEAR